MKHSEIQNNEILIQRRIASVATIDSNGFPHVTSVWFYYDEGVFWLAIPSSSAKAKNLSQNNKIAIMIDVRVAGKEFGITASGECDILRGEAAEEAVKLIHSKYLTEDGVSDPDVGPAFAAFDDMVIRLVPSKWISWDMAALDQAAFGGKLGSNSYLKQIEP